MPYTAPIFAPPPKAVVTSVTANNVSSVLLPANVNRRQFTIFNDSGANIFIALAAIASLTSFTMRLQDNNFYESALNGYTGVVSVVRQGAGSGAIRITELTN